MNYFDDFDEQFDNRVKLFADILDNPILTTDRELAFSSVLLAQTACKIAASTMNFAETTYNQRYARFRNLMQAEVKRDLSEKELGALRWMATYCWQGDVKLIDIRDRFKIITDLASLDGAVIDWSDLEVKARSLYDSMRSAASQQLECSLEYSPLPEVRKLSTEALDEIKKYANVNELLERVIHKRQSDGLSNLPGSVNLELYRGGDRVGRLCTEGDTVLFKLGSDVQITSWDDLLCWRSLSLFRRNAFLVAGIDPSIPLSLHQDLMSMFSWQEECIVRLGNSGYELLKMTEPMFKARLMQLADGYMRDDSFGRMADKGLDKEIKLGSDGTLMKRLISITQSVVDKRCAAELFGALKFSGHPYIDPRLASASSKEFGTSEGNISVLDTFNIRHQVCDMILRGYLKKHSRWPPLQFFTTGTKLQLLCKGMVLNFPDGAYDLKDWLSCRFYPFMDMDFSVDYLDMMEDKSLGLDPQDAWKAWTELKRQNPRLSAIPNDRSKKLMVRLLSLESFDPEQIARTVQTADLTQEDLCFALYPKEKEFKLEARLFVMLNFAIRFFLALVEKNFKRLLKDYITEQSMTKGRKKTMQYLEEMSKSRRSDKEDTVFIELDLTRWNLNWRGATVDWSSFVADDIFGEPNMFSRGHDIFSAATIVVRVADDPPPGVSVNSNPRDWPESHYVWRNHLGGFEGIMQGQWTLCTQALIKLVMRTQPVIGYKLLGQGDNQVLAVNYKRDPGMDPNQQASLVADFITKALEVRFANINQVIKPEECLVSRTTVTYSKILWVDGVQVPTTLKHAATVSPSGTTTIPSIMSGLTSICSGSRACADAFQNPGVAYYYYLLLHRDYLQRSLASAPSSPALNLRFKPETLDLASLWPSDLGGLPTQGPSDFLYGGASDHLSASISTAVLAARFNATCNQLLGYLDTDQPWALNPDATQLLDDPFSIPIPRAVLPAARIDNAMKSVVSSVTRNKDIKPIFSTQISQYESDLRQALTTTRPFYPLLMADALDLSVVGVKKKIMKKFTGTRTIQQLVRDKAPINYKDTIILGDKRRVIDFVNLMRQAQDRKLASSLPARCIFKRAQQYRKRWFPGEPSLVVEGVTTLHPFEAKLITTSCNGDYIEFNAQGPLGRLDSSVGPYPGRWGDKTWEHRRSTGVELLGRNKAILAAKRLLLMESQLAAGGNLKKVLRSILQQRTTVDEDLLERIMPTVVGGVAAHRWDSTVEDKAFAWLGPINVTQHLQVQTDSMITLSGGLRDFCFCFQEHVFFGAQIARSYSAVTSDKNLHFKLLYDIHPEHEIVSQPITGPPAAIDPPPNLTTFQSNPLVCAADVIYQALSEELPPSVAPVIKLTDPDRTQRIEILTHWFLDQLLNPSLSDAALSSDFAPAGMSLDVGVLAGSGLELACVAAGRAVMLRATVMSMERTEQVKRPSIQLLIEKLAPVAAFPMSRFLTAPGVKEQDFVTKYRLSPNPGRHGRISSMNRLISVIKKSAYVSFRDVFYSKVPRIICSSYASRATPSRLLECVASVLIFILKGGERRECIRQFRVVRSKVMEEGFEKDRSAHWLGFLRSSPWVKNELAELLQDDFKSGRTFCRVQLGFEESLRLLRLPLQGLSSKRQSMLNSIIKAEGTTVDCVDQSSPVEPEELSCIPDRNLKDATVALIERNFGLRWGGSSLSRESLPVFHKFKSDIAEESVLMVGVGWGTMVKDLLMIGARRVVGVELLEDMPDSPQLGSAYIPSEIHPSLESKFRWDPSVFRHGGDWFDPEVHASALASDNFRTVVIDIHTKERSFFKKISVLLSSGFKGRVITREILSEAEIPIIAAVITATFGRSWFCRFTAGNTSYVWMSFKTTGCDTWSTGRLSRQLDLSISPRQECCPNEDFYPDQREVLLRELCGGRIMEDLQSAARSLRELINQRDKSTVPWRDYSRASAALVVIEELIDVEGKLATKDEWYDFLADLSSFPVDILREKWGVPSLSARLVREFLTRIIPRVIIFTPGANWEFVPLTLSSDTI